MGLRETKRNNIFVINKTQRQRQKQKQKLQKAYFKLKTRKGKVTRKLKIRVKIKLKPLKRGGRILPYPLKKYMKNTIKPLSAHPLNKLLEAPIPNKVIDIKTMCIILSMHILITPKEKEAIEKKFEDIIEKMLEIYSRLEMKPFRVKLLAKYRAELEEIKKSKLKPQSHSQSSKSQSKLVSLSKSVNKSKKLLKLLKSYIGKKSKSSKRVLKNKSRNINKNKYHSKNQKVHYKSNIMYGGRVVELEGDWEEYPPLATMTYMNCVATSYRVLNLLNADEADEIGRESANGLSERATIKWLNKIYGDTHYSCRIWTSNQVIDSEYMEELDNFFENLLPYENTGTMVSITGHYFNVVRNEFNQIVFYDLQARWCFENESEDAYIPDQYYWAIRNQDFYQFFLSNNPSFGTKRGAYIEVICQDYTVNNFIPTRQNHIERTHTGRYAIETLKETRREEGNSPHYYEEEEEEEEEEEGEEGEEYDEDAYWEDNWHNSYNQWYNYSKSELLSIINGRTRIPFSESKKENASRFFMYRYGWDGKTRDHNENIDNRYNYNEDVYVAPEYHVVSPDETYAFRGMALMRPPEITHDRYNFDVYDSSCDIGQYGQVDNPTSLDIQYNYDTLWTLCSYAKYIRFWINAYMFGQNNINTESFNVTGLKNLMRYYEQKSKTLTEYVTNLGVAIEDYSSPIYRDKVGIGHSNTFYKIQIILQKTINLLYTFISNIKAVINRKSGRREYIINQRVVNRGKIQQLFVKEATLPEFRQVTGDDKGCRFNKKKGGFSMAGGSKNINQTGGSGIERLLLERLRQENGADENRGAGGRRFERGAANRPRPREQKRKRNEKVKYIDLTTIINCALDPRCPNQKLGEEYINSPNFERRVLCEPRENLEEIVRVMRQTEVGGRIPHIPLKIIRIILPLIEMFEFTDLPALTILEYIYANTEEDKEELVGEKFMDSSFYDKAIEYIFTEEFFDKAMREEIDWSNFDSFTDPEMSEEEIEEIQEHINDMAQRYNPEYVIIEEVYGEYSGGYLNSLIPIYISETIIGKSLMSDETRAAVNVFIEDNYTTEYIEKIRTYSWPIDEEGFRRRTTGSMYEHYAYENEELN
jgi:hypothetical protein